MLSDILIWIAQVRRNDVLLYGFGERVHDIDVLQSQHCLDAALQRSWDLYIRAVRIGHAAVMRIHSHHRSLERCLYDGDGCVTGNQQPIRGDGNVPETCAHQEVRNFLRLCFSWRELRLKLRRCQWRESSRCRNERLQLCLIAQLQCNYDAQLLSQLQRTRDHVMW